MDTRNQTLNKGKWSNRFLELAKLISSWSKDPSTQVGAVIVDQDRQVVATGYNGFPRRMVDDSRLHDRETKYKFIVHGELNALAQAAKRGISVEGCTLYTTPLPPCVNCAKFIVQAGITQVVSTFDGMPERWYDSCQEALDLFAECHVLVFDEHGNLKTRANPEELNHA